MVKEKFGHTSKSQNIMTMIVDILIGYNSVGVWRNVDTLVKYVVSTLAILFAYLSSSLCSFLWQNGFFFR